MNWSSEHLRSAKVAAHRSKQRTCAYKMLVQSFPTRCTYVDIDVTHMIMVSDHPPPLLHTASIKNWVVIKEMNSQLKEHMVASFPGPEEGEEKDRCLGITLILFPCPEQWAATFCTLQKSNTCKKWAPPHTTLANLVCHCYCVSVTKLVSDSHPF